MRKKTLFTAKLIYVFIVAAAMMLSLFCGCVIPSEPVQPDEVRLTFVQSVVEIEVGESVEFTAEYSVEGESVAIFSADSSIASVDGNIVTGVSVGKTQIAAVAGNLSAVCEVSVVQPKTEEEQPPKPETPDSVVIMLSPVTVEVGKTVALSVISPTGTPLKWFCANSAVASVQNGIITGVSVGETTVSVSAGAASATCSVKVVAPAVTPTPTPTPKPDDEFAKDGYSLVWHDEFDGTALDTSKWGYQLGVQDSYGNSKGPYYWGNNEQQYYTDSTENVGVKDGSLYITAKRQDMGDRRFTSARILTRDKFSRTYGYFEARMKTPTGNGMWPAFWMLPQPATTQNSNNIYGGWPTSGEIDIMEARGRLIDKVDTTLHFATADGGHRYRGEQTELITPTDDWHTYAVDWTEEYIAWIIDGKQVMKFQSSVWTNPNLGSANAPFDKPFFMLLNFAVGGNYDGGVEPDANFTSATMYVDYVRVWEKN